jgi:putative membrane protein
MEITAAPVIIILGIWLFFENALVLKKQNKSLIPTYSAWAVTVIVLSMFFEGVGVKTGALFGEYKYGDYLYPYIYGVPVSIGFAWLTVLLASASVTQILTSKLYHLNSVSAAVLIALFMTLFDVFMEPAAVKLDYWSWIHDTVPLQNYFTWFIVGYIFAYLGLRLKILNNHVSKIGIHFYIVQIFYFLMVYFS